MTANRKLDLGNANPGNLGTDFAKLGIHLWPELKARYPKRANRWNSVLEELNTLRNGIAHSDETKIASIRSPVNVATWRRRRSTLGDAAHGLDAVLGSYLVNITGAGW